MRGAHAPGPRLSQKRSRVQNLSEKVVQGRVYGVFEARDLRPIVFAAVGRASRTSRRGRGARLERYARGRGHPLVVTAFSCALETASW